MRTLFWLALAASFPGAQAFAGKTCQASFSFRQSNAQTVWLAGSFNDWAARPSDGAVPLVRTGDTWTVQLPLPAGKNLYKFIINGQQWVTDPLALSSEADAFGGTNSVFQCGTDPSVSRPLAQCGEPDAFDWRDTVMYFAMVDRFSDSDGINSPVPGASGNASSNGASAQYEGGDFKGMTQRLDYLSKLGVTALWMSAPFDNRNEAGSSVTPNLDGNQYSGYHGYWPSPDNIDYSNRTLPQPRPRVESRYGSEDDLRQLVSSAQSQESANQHGIRVLFDYVMKHVDLNSGLYKAHPEWFTRFNGRLRVCGPENLWDDAYWTTRCSFTDYLPGFDFYNPAVRNWSIQDLVWWAKEFGVDGMRLDAIKHVPMEWLTELRSTVKREFPEPKGKRFYLVGETFDYTNRDSLKRFVDSQTMLDGQFDFPLRKQLCDAIFRPDGSLQALDTWMQGNDRFYDRGTGNPSLMVNWLGNHDIPRAIHFASGQIDSCFQGSSPANGWSSQQFQQPQEAAPYERLSVGFALLMSSPGIPLIYYGDEIGLAGGGDPDNRRMMPWDDSQLNSHQLKLRDKVQKLARLRGEYKVLGRGQRQTHFVDRDGWVYSMNGCEDLESVTMVINKSDSWKTMPLPGGRFEDLLDGGVVNDKNLSVPPRSFRVLKAL